MSTEENNAEQEGVADSNTGGASEPCDESCEACNSANDPTAVDAPGAEPVRQMTLEEEGDYLSDRASGLAEAVKEYAVRCSECTLPTDIDRGEIVANATLARRHLQDATFRLTMVDEELHQGAIHGALPGENTPEPQCQSDE